MVERARLIPLIAALVLISCAGAEEPVIDRPELRDAIAIRYVVPNILDVRAQPRDDAEIIASFASGESVSVLEDRDGWSEVRLVGKTGWVPSDQIVDSRDSFVSTPDAVRWRIKPKPVPGPNAAGEIVYELSINKEGVVTAARPLRNTTGSAALEAQNRQSLLNARFFPMIDENGETMEFKYEYRVNY